MTITSTYQTYRTLGYTYQIAGSDQRSTGGVHLHQIRRTKSGYLHRIVQSNGRHTDATKGVAATKGQIEAAQKAK